MRQLASDCKRWIRRFLIRTGAWRPPVYPGDDVHVRGTGMWGTLGVYVRKNGELHGLTCEHVLAAPGERPRRGAPVQSRSKAPGAQNARSARLGVVEHWLEIDYTGKRTSLDAALVRVGSRRVRHLPHTVGATCSEVTTEREVMESFQQMSVHGHRAAKRVEKFGSKTGHTRGVIQGYFNLKPQEFPFRIDGVYEIESTDDQPVFCDDGDSGAIVWDSSVSPKRAVGLLVANTFLHKGFAIPIEVVLRKLDAEIVGTD